MHWTCQRFLREASLRAKRVHSAVPRMGGPSHACGIVEQRCGRLPRLCQRKTDTFGSGMLWPVRLPLCLQYNSISGGSGGTVFQANHHHLLVVALLQETPCGRSSSGGSKPRRTILCTPLLAARSAYVRSTFLTLPKRRTLRPLPDFAMATWSDAAGHGAGKC